MFQSTALSLRDLLGSEYIEAAVAGASFLTGQPAETFLAAADEKVALYPEAHRQRLDELSAYVGKNVAPGLEASPDGAATDSFRKVFDRAASPVSCFGPYRVGESGKLYFTGKSEHYHTPLGHAFPGFKLVENAKKLLIGNATHNNTRGYVTRLMERELVRCANGGALPQPDASGVLNRVLSLETGSLAVEAGIKMMLARFFRYEAADSAPVHSGKTPVFLVMGDGGANYHGTTVLAQTLRGLWPEIPEKAGDLYRVAYVTPNDPGDFAEKIRRNNQGSLKTAGFLHEIVMMNHGGLRLTDGYLQGCYALCREYGTPTLCDEIQSCLWTEELLLFKRVGIRPDCVAVGKGFPAGEYPASRLILTKEMDSLAQFGALVTNGQEELASLVYLISMAFCRLNGEHIRTVGEAYHRGLEALVEGYPALLTAAEGEGFLSSLTFKTMESAVLFAKGMSASCVDVSAQTYKKSTPPAVLTKLPVITTEVMADMVLSKMEGVLRSIGGDNG
ncbi:MAG: aminotransferase class III-fold pyridoxal phosphate-dependent enzyme [Oscillospiraceae bacterium]|jgi:acetylornithine/succinyldiaminopimelate/putrescine aminotransferase|nr:aminotransferase class III-fold pyridoxal phosphate-dependent enzyme [Oscillospiraceae bacterium]